MKLACHSVICAKKYLHAAPLPTLKTAIVKCRPVWSIAPHMMWYAKQLSNLRLGHAIADLCESILGNCIAENKEQDKGDAEQQTGKHYQNLGLALHGGARCLTTQAQRPGAWAVSTTEMASPGSLQRLVSEPTSSDEEQ